MTSPPRELLEFLDGYDPAVQALALGLRNLIHEVMAPCHEYIFEMRSKVVLLYGATERVIDDGVCSIGVFARHVTLAFTRGIDLNDPAGILKGTGKAMRHVRLTTLSDLDRPDIRALLLQARRNAGIKRRRDRSTDEVVTRVKQKARVKRPVWPRTFG